MMMRMFKCAFVVLYFFACNCKFTQGLFDPRKFHELSRSKRTLLWKKGSTRIQVITGLGIPVDLSLETVIIGAIFKGNYQLPTNISDYTNSGIVYERKKRSLSRWDIYEMLAQMAEARGFSGKPCILRAICELADNPVDKDYGLLAEFVHAIFDPQSTNEDLKEHTNNEYLAAHHWGMQSGESCKAQFSECTVNPIDLITMPHYT